MDSIVIYGSKHGTAKRYAVELSGRIGVQAKSYESCGSLEGFDAVIYICAEESITPN